MATKTSKAPKMTFNATAAVVCAALVNRPVRPAQQYVFAAGSLKLAAKCGLMVQDEMTALYELTDAGRSYAMATCLNDPGLVTFCAGTVSVKL